MCDAPEAPRVSIIVPTYNRDHLLTRSLCSLLQQTEPRFEVVVVDDASECDVRSTVEAIGDPRVGYIRLPKNSGPAAARNRGVREAKASLVAFQDSDDEWFPAKLEKQLAALEAGGHEVGVVTCDMIRVHASGKRTYHRTPDIQRGRLLHAKTGFYQTFAFGTQTALLRRKLFERVSGFDESMRCFEDSDLFLRLAAITEFRRIAEPLVWYHETGGLATDHRAEVQARMKMWRKHARALWHEEPRFVIKEASLLAVRALVGDRTAGWRGRPFGPQPPEPGLKAPCRTRMDGENRAHRLVGPS